MRTVCFVVFVTSVLSTPSVASALTNETLYRWCKPYADSGFNSTSDDALLCSAYITGALDYAARVCTDLEPFAKSNSDYAFVRSYLGAKFETSNKPVIQAYVNKMRNEPSEWKYNPNAALREVISEVGSCE